MSARRTGRQAWLLAALIALVAPDHVAAQQPVRLGRSLKSIQIHRIPPPPGGGDWDPGILRNIFLGNMAGIYPDIEICLGLGARSVCQAVCTNAQLHPDDPEKQPPTVCKLSVEGTLIIATRLEYPVPTEPERTWVDLAVAVNEFDATLNAQPKRPIGRFSLYPNRVPVLPTPETCTDASPCTLPVEQFMVSFVTVDGGVLGTPDTTRGHRAPPPLAGAPKPGDTSYYDRAKKWWDDFLWDKAKEPAGFRGTLLEGLAEQAAKARTNYADCLHDFIAEPKNNLASRFELVCAGKSGDALTSCAYQVIAENRPDVAQACQTNEVTYGFLANMWRSACGIVKMSC